MAGKGSAARSAPGKAALRTAVYALILACAFAVPSVAGDELAAAGGRVLLVLFSEQDCPYCARLRRDFLEPMQRNEGYRRRIDFAEIDIHKRPELARRYGVKLVPTVLLVGPGGEPLAEPLVGYNGPDFYGAYLDERIDRALAALR
jgi:thioredoxin-related protein